MTWLADKLNKRIKIQQVVETPNAGGGADRTFNDIAEVWAGIKQIKESGYLAGKQVNEYPTHKFTVRMNRDIVKDLFIRLEKGSNIKDRFFRIAGITNVGERDEYLEILAKEIEEEDVV